MRALARLGVALVGVLLAAVSVAANGAPTDVPVAEPVADALDRRAGTRVSGAASAARAEVDVQDNTFVPKEIEIEEGDSVRWSQSGDNPHSVTADDGSFDSHPNCSPVCMGNGDSFETTFETAGRFPYHCRVHGDAGGLGMSGVVVVRAAGAEAAGAGDEERAEQEEAAPEETAEVRAALPGTGVAPGLSTAAGAALVVFSAAGGFLLARRGRRRRLGDP